MPRPHQRGRRRLAGWLGVLLPVVIGLSWGKGRAIPLAFAGRRYVLPMVARLSARVEELLAAAAELAPDERQALAEGLWSAPAREHSVAADDRHAEVVRRVETIRRGDAETLSLAEVEQSLRAELDF